MTAVFLDIGCSVSYMTTQQPTDAGSRDDLAGYRRDLEKLGAQLDIQRTQTRLTLVRSSLLAVDAYRAGLTQSEIARLLGVARSSVIDWINGPKPVDKT